MNDAKFGHVFFLGGQDLEMVTIRDLLLETGAMFHDKRLGWGARASDYRAEIDAALAAGDSPTLIELELDVRLPEERITVVDHHDHRAGTDARSSLRQVFDLLALPPERWTREFELVDANDRGHIPGMIRSGATADDIVRIRAADRAAQGVTADEQKAAREAIAERISTPNGDLTLVRVPHSKASVVADLMHAELGGPGYTNLVVLSPTEINVFAEGWIVSALKEALPQGWSGGDLPERGFWGCRRHPEKT